MIFVTIVALSLLRIGDAQLYDPELFREKIKIDDGPELGEKALINLLKDKIIPFKMGPYFKTEPTGKAAELVQSFNFQNFSIITSGASSDNGADFWEEKESYTTGEAIEAERVTGVVGLKLELFEGVAEIRTPKSDGAQLCQVIGSSREYSPIGRDYDYIGNPALKILFQVTVVKKPFPYVVNDYMLDASTRPIYSVYNATVAQPFRFDYHVDPSCPLGLNRTELGSLERVIDESVSLQLREVLMRDLIRRGFFNDAIKPYAESIGAKIPEEEMSTFHEMVWITAKMG